jgi:hypothetical protein
MCFDAALLFAALCFRPQAIQCFHKFFSDSYASFVVLAERNTLTVILEYNSLYTSKTDDCDWLEILFIMDSSYPLRGK